MILRHWRLVGLHWLGLASVAGACYESSWNVSLVIAASAYGIVVVCVAACVGWGNEREELTKP